MLTWFANLTLFWQIAVIYLLLINLITFFYFGIDKMKSQLQKRRVSEKTLWVLALVGGSVGALVGMSFFRHKTKKMSFQAGVAVILAVQIVIIVFLNI